MGVFRRAGDRYLWVKAIAFSGNGLDIKGYPRIVFDVTPQEVDLLRKIGLLHRLIRPDRGKEILLLYDLAGLFDQKKQYFEPFSCQRNESTVTV